MLYSDIVRVCPAKRGIYMKYSIKKRSTRCILLTVILALVLSTLLSCGNRVTKGEKKKIEKAFAEQWDWEMELTLNESGEIVDCSGMIYYGKFGGAHVFYYRSPFCAIENKKIAKEKISDSNMFSIFVYKNGKVCEIEDAYKNMIISRSNVADIARYHYKYRITSSAAGRNDCRDYGSYRKCDVGFNENSTSKEGDYSLTVAGYEFKHNKEFSIWAYAEGETRGLAWLYENGYLTAKDIKAIYDLHIGYYK